MGLRTRFDADLHDDKPLELPLAGELVVLVSALGAVERLGFDDEGLATGPAVHGAVEHVVAELRVVGDVEHANVVHNLGHRSNGQPIPPYYFISALL